MNTESESTAVQSEPKHPAPLSSIERRILGVLMEKARTTPDVYPLSMNALVTGCNQKSNRTPMMNLSEQQVEDAVLDMRQKQLVAEVHGGGRVSKFRHFGYDYMGVKGVEAAVMTELLLRGEQTAGELRTRASRFDNIADLNAMTQILDNLQKRGLVIALTPHGRGQLFSHNLYEPQELDSLKSKLSGYTGEESGSEHSIGASRSAASGLTQDVEHLKAEIQELRSLVEQLQQRVSRLEQ